MVIPGLFSNGVTTGILIIASLCDNQHHYPTALSKIMVITGLFSNGVTTGLLVTTGLCDNQHHYPT